MSLWTLAHQVPLSVEFSRQEYSSGLPFPSPGDLPDTGIESRSPALQADSLPSEPPGNPRRAANRPHHPRTKGFFSAGHRCNGLSRDALKGEARGDGRCCQTVPVGGVCDPLGASYCHTSWDKKQVRWNRSDTVPWVGRLMGTDFMMEP